MEAKWNVLLVMWIYMLVGAHSSTVQPIFGIFKKSTVFSCPLEPKAEIEWFDWVYNENGDAPAVIFQTGTLNQDEHHGERFNVDTIKGTMTVSQLQKDDVGTYICKNGDGEEYMFELAIGNMPECSGHVSDLREMTETHLTCEMKYSGTAPTLEWLQEGEMLESNDDTDLQTAMKTVDVDVTSEMDKQEFKCRAIAGDLVEECMLVFDVKYSVREIMVKPDLKEYPAGSDIMCSATGNPTPKVSATLPDGSKIYGDGHVTITVSEEWEVGSMQKILCRANNTVDTKLEDVSKQFDVMVAEKTSDTDSVTGASSQLTGIIAGVVIAAVVLVIIIIVVVVIKKRKSKPPKGSKPVPTKETKDDANA